MSDISQERFREQVGTIFHVALNGDEIPLRLVELVVSPSVPGVEQFSLFFHGAADRVLPQSTYPFTHEALGSFFLFIVPVIGSNAERIVYQAAFSRLIAT